MDIKKQIEICKNCKSPKLRYPNKNICSKCDKPDLVKVAKEYADKYK